MVVISSHNYILSYSENRFILLNLIMTILRTQTRAAVITVPLSWFIYINE
jgi:hypothetical protein